MTGPVFESSECLEWISAELSNSLRDASGALERFVEAPEQREPLGDVVTELQRILGALRVVEVAGAALLAEEMVYVAAALEQGAIKDSREGLEALSRSIVQLPAYLDRILAGGRDIPLVLLPLLNDLRAVRGSPLLSENTLFLLNVDTDIDRPARQQPSGSDVVTAARKLRPRYQSALLGWLRGAAADSNLATMGAVAANIEQAATSQALYQLYWIVGAVIEALREDGLDSGVAIKRLLGQADRYLKQLIDSGERSFDENPPSQLVNNLLYYVARATSGGERVRAVKAAFSLDEMLPGDGQLEAARDSLAAPSAQLMETVAAAIRQDLESVKDVLDIRMRTGATEVDDLVPQIDTLKRVADTLAMLGLGDLRSAVLAERDRFASWIAGTTATSDDEMLASASVLLSLEDGLQAELLELISFDEPAPAPEEEEAVTANPDALRESDFRAVATAVLRECLVNLSRVKESLSQFLAANTHSLDNVPALLRAINAGLLMLGKSRAVGVVDRIADYCRHRLHGSEAADFSEQDMDRLADAIVSIEYYLDTLRRGRSDPWYMLDNASLCLDAIAAPKAAAVSTPRAPAATQPGPETPEPGAQTEPPVLTAAVDSTGEVRQITPALRDPRGIDPELLETFIEEAREEIASITQNWPAWRDGRDREQLTVVRRSFHTLKGSGRMVGAERIGEMGWSVENLLNKFLNGTIEAQPDLLAVIDDAVAALPGLLEELEVGTPSETDVDAIIARARAIATGESAPPAPAPARTRGMDPVLYEIFRNETDTHLAGVDRYLDEARHRGSAPPFTEDLHRAWHTLNGSASMAGATAIAQIAQPIQRFVRDALDEEREIGADTVAVFGEAVAAIRDIVGRLNEDTRIEADAALLERIDALAVRAEAAEPEPEPVPAEQAQDEIASIFGDEATELLDAADLALQRVDRDAGDRSSFSELQRHLHTLKGGARMAGVSAIGDLSHELESLLLSIDGADQRVVGLVQESIDRMHNMAEALRGGREVRVADDLIERIQALAQPAAAWQPPTEAAPVEPPSQEPAAPPAAAAPDDAPAAPDEEREVTYAFASQERSAARELFSEEVGERRESARVSADLLDDLLNNVGEVSIYHSRLEQQINTIGFNTAELARTVVRLREQLRKLEMETEAQILHGHQEAGTRADFDPLEMDRYSMIQQLSRALAESVSDLSSIQGLLDELTRDAETLLVQQSRVTTELQDGLMRTRMVPFQRHVPRFSRLVRQTAAEADKRAELIVDGAGELDRQVLDRMLAPFEHMLRNAVIHGIESPQERERLGKPVTGTITISLVREGAEMVIEIRDDGAGMDLDGIRDKARALGLIEADAELTETEVLQLALEPGFSTASELTQSAGRGVGMDVVANVVKQLGGSLAIHSVRGRGATFTVRLPLTLAISQALLVRAGEEIYAIPVLSLAGVARLSTTELREYLDDENPQFDYGGALYRLEHLGHLLGMHGTDLDMIGSSVALVLARAGEHSTALIVDEIVGSREVVVKPVGPQIAAVRGVAGATILGDGSIVVILDINALVRSARPARLTRQPPPEPRDERPSIMVVDDSITVRRVTQRLLERHEMRVTTAKDGVDAVSAMQEAIPDLILLDIEMPRMDGYEVATHVRNSPRLQHVPIVMVTSRVGDKHRNRAIELGVNAYLGKPYQEAILLETIKPLLRRAPMTQT